MGNNRLRIMSIVGARPNMMKIAPLLAELCLHEEIEPVLVHTGQHYDYSMSQVFFDQLHLPHPDYNLEVGSGKHYAQTAEIMRKFGELVEHDRPDMVLVAGDVNSTLACALVAAKERIPVAHVEAGLRSFDRTMPEEINRILTDALSDLLFTTEESANRNLSNEGVDPGKVFFVGNLMIDSLMRAMERSRASSLRSELGLNAQAYAVLTLHRPSNVDDQDQLTRTLDAIAQVAQRIPVIFPAHPRTARNIEAAREAAGLRAVRTWNGGEIAGPGLWMMPPASYLDFLDLIQHAVMVITDSGGVQEETTFLGVPCLTYRDNTERPVTVSMGTNKVVGRDPGRLLDNALDVLENGGTDRSTVLRPPLWDGQTAPRIVHILKEAWQQHLRLYRGACASVTQSALSESSSLTQAIEALRTWIETRQFAGYEPFDLLNSPYLSGAWARKALPAILLIQAGKRFAGLRLRQTLKIPPSRNPKALGLCLSAYCDLAQAGYDVSAEAAWLKNELIRLRSPRETEYCWGYDWDYVSLRGTRLPVFAPNCIASYFCGTAMMEMHKVFADSEALEIAESVARFLATRLNRSFESADEVCFSYTPNDKMQIYNSSALTGAFLARRAACGKTGLPFAGTQSHGFSAKRPTASGRMVLRAASAATLDRQFS